MDLALEETNRIRASLGMKPLPSAGGSVSISEPLHKKRKTGNASTDESSSDSDDAEDDGVGSTLESRQEEGYANWKTLHEDNAARTARDAKAAAIKKARDAAQRFSRLAGSTLADENEDGADVDTRTWLLQQKQRRKKIEKERAKAERLEQELLAREMAALEETGKDLSGVHVAHDLADFEGMEEHVLTLKDATIEENEEEGDELENVTLKEQETLQERLNAKKKKPVYDPLADNDGNTTGARILRQYDETIGGKSKKRFQLEGQGVSSQDREAMKEIVSARLKAQPIRLDLPAMIVDGSDYVEPSEAKIRKPKKKKKSQMRQKVLDEDDIFPPEPIKMESNGERTLEANGSNAYPTPADDDDLQASLARQRKEALRKRKRLRPEDIARQLKEEESNGMDLGVGSGDEGGGLLIDETTEFVASLQRSKEEEKDRVKVKLERETDIVKPEFTPTDPDVNMENTLKQEDEEVDEMLPEDSEDPATEISKTGLEEEATISQGVGATLNMLSQRGLINLQDKDDNLVGLQRDRQKFLLEKRRRETDLDRRAKAQRERDRASGRLDHMSAREREEYARQENKQRDQVESRAMSEVFSREYKPNVELKYVDDHGRLMNKKEAFKHLSHHFHGKGSGKQKTEKFLKKIEDDKRRDAASLLDSSQATGMNNAVGATAKKNRQAGVRLA